MEERRCDAAASAPACDIRWNATWTAAAVGAAASFPPGPILGVAAASLEAGLLAQIEARAKARLLARELALALPRLGLRAVVGPAAPVVGAAWSAAGNALEMYRRLTPAVLALDDVPGDLSRGCGDSAARRAARPEWMLSATAAA